MSDTPTTKQRVSFLCLDEDTDTGGTGTRCDQQCAECREQERHEREDQPQEDADG